MSEVVFEVVDVLMKIGIQYKYIYLYASEDLIYIYFHILTHFYVNTFFIL